MSDAALPPRMPHRITVTGTAIAVTALVVAGNLASAGLVSGYAIAFTAPMVAYAVMGALVLAVSPGHLMGRLMVAAGAAAIVALLGISWTVWLPAAWLSQWAWWPPFGLITLALLVFPDGHLPSPRWRPVAALIASGTAAATVALAVAALDHPRDLVITGAINEITPRAQLLIRVAAIGALLTVVGLLAVLWALWLRWRRAEGDTRQQLACLFPAAILFGLGLFVLDPLGVPQAFVVIAVALPLGMCVAVVRYRLYGLDQVVNRTIVWLLMTVMVIVVFISIVTLLRDVVLGATASTASLVATGLIAVTFEPLRQRVQRGVNRLVYGERDDPYLVISRLGELLERTVEPNAVLPRLTETIARSLRVPYVGVEIERNGNTRLVAEHGHATTSVDTFGMIAHGERLGRLIVANRSAGSRFSRRERRLLDDLAVQAAVAVEATRLVRDLQNSREQLVMAREEERRRARRDLHDGLGPTMAGMSMQVRAALKLVGGDPKAGGILTALAEDLQACTDEVRRMVDQLRPPALDAGLAAALRTECRRFTSPTLSVQLRASGTLDGLPAAVEVAAYRVVAEALTNVARHAQARSCLVSVSRQRMLSLEIVDDGVGIAAPALRGVGLDSMRDRAEELGGTCVITEADPRGTTVRVSLPLPAQAVDG
ncbi:MAG TPA: histidine kinase [Candidatus Limnocylindrales bacterium]